MNSGQDDVAFLRALAGYIQESYHPSKLYLSGHSNGGMMTNRMWCETGNQVFDAFIAFDGPASGLYNPNPQAGDSEKSLQCSVPLEGTSIAPPFLSVLALKDSVVGNTPEKNMDKTLWTIPGPTYFLASYAYSRRILLNDWFAHEQLRAPIACRQFPSRAQFYTRSNMKLWSACGGRVGVLAFAEPVANCSKFAAGHCIAYLQVGLGAGLLDFALEWARTDGATSKYLPAAHDNKAGVSKPSLADLEITGYPHKIDLFVPSSTPLYGMVFLHGGGGTKDGVEISLGLTVEWAEEHRVVVAVPQGQSLQTCCEY